MPSRLAPLVSPRTLLQRLMYAITRRQYGVVLSPVRVIYARKPRLAFLGQHIASTFERGLLLDADLVLLAKTLVARLNGCAFCQDLALASAIQKQMGTERFAALDDYATSPLFPDRERAALAFCAEATRQHAVSEATFESARDHFSEAELVELAWIAAAETYFNIQSAVFRLGADGLADRARLGISADRLAEAEGTETRPAPPAESGGAGRTPLAKASGGTAGNSRAGVSPL